jgi:hypothetical protein
VSILGRCVCERRPQPVRDDAREWFGRRDACRATGSLRAARHRCGLKATLLADGMLWQTESLNFIGAADLGRANTNTRRYLIDWSAFRAAEINASRASSHSCRA